jgi:hypothetical protein
MILLMMMMVVVVVMMMMMMMMVVVMMNMTMNDMGGVREGVTVLVLDPIQRREGKLVRHREALRWGREDNDDGGGGGDAATAAAAVDDDDGGGANDDDDAHLCGRGGEVPGGGLAGGGEAQGRGPRDAHSVRRPQPQHVACPAR